MISMQDSAKAYARIGIETGVGNASPNELVLMLYDGAILEIGKARIALKNRETPEKCRAISHAMAIIQDGLQLSLNVKVGGEIAENLNDLYDYMGNRLLLANLNNADEPLAEVGRLLGELRSAWEEIGKQPIVPPKAENMRPPRSNQPGIGSTKFSK